MTTWVMLTANITPEQNEGLRAVLAKTGQNRAEWVRSMIDHAVRLLDEQEIGETKVATAKHAKGCLEHVRNRWGCSPPTMEGPCRTCWPDLPTDRERVGAQFYVRTCDLDDRFSGWPWWAVVHHTRRLIVEEE